MKNRTSLISILLLLLVPFFSLAQEVGRFEKFNTKDGLSQSTVLSSFCDSQGFLWFGTMDGLNRYDGHNFFVYRKQSKNSFSISHNRVVKIWEDKNNFIWVKTHDGHFHYLDQRTDNFYSFPETANLRQNTNVRITNFLEVNDHEIWLGTDGAGVYQLTKNDQGIYSSKHYSTDGPNKISDNNIRFIFADSNSAIWIGTANGINKVQNSNEDLNFQHYLTGKSFTSIVEIKGQTFFGTEAHGIFSKKSNSKDFEKYNQFEYSDRINLLKKTSSNHLLVGTSNNGLMIINPTTKSQSNYFKNRTILRIYESKNEDLWIVSDKAGISRIPSSNSLEEHYKLVHKVWESKMVEERHVIHEDHLGRMWFGTHGGGLALFDSENKSMKFFRNIPKDDTSISSDIIHCITQDHSNIMWVGTGQSVGGGVNKIIPENPLFSQIQPKIIVESDRNNVVKGMLVDDNNNIWIGTKSGHIYIYDEWFQLKTELKNTPKSPNIPPANIYSIIQDKEGYIWLGSKSKGVAVSQKPLNAYKNYSDIKFYSYQNNPNDSESLSNNYVYSIIQDQAENIWIGTYGGGLNLVKDRSPQKLTCSVFNTKNSNLSSDNVRNIYQNKQGEIWICTTYGLNLVDSISPSNFISYTTTSADASINYNDVISIFEDSSERMWFGTFGGGLNYLEKGDRSKNSFKLLTSEDGLISDAIFGILEDKFHNIWISTSNGISKYNPSTKEFNNFDNFNGLVSSDFNENSCLALNNGALLFGNIEGFLKINPGEVHIDNFQPPVVFTDFYLFNKKINPTNEDAPIDKQINFVDQIILEHNQSSFSLEYSALSYFDPNKNSYAYTLENFDPVWYEVKNERKANYTNIPPGDYTFKVKASNWNGTWNDTPKELHIKILSPWWKTYPAYFGYFIIGLGLFLFFRKTYLNYYKLQTNLKVEKRVNEIKLQFFTNISHEIRTPLTLILGPLADLSETPNLPTSIKTQINTMNRNGKRILRLVNQLLDFRKIQNKKMKLRVEQVEINTFINEICQNFNQLARQKNINFSYPEANYERIVWIDKEKIDSVVFNLLSNAFKFTKKNQSIAITISENEKNIRISIHDQGQGIPKKRLPFIFDRFNSLDIDDANFSGTGIGLAYSQEITKLHSGAITVESEIGKGSIFTLKIPTGKSHFSPEDFLSSEVETVQNYSHADKFNLEYVAEIEVEPSESKTKKHTIVIVEDDIEIINYIEAILSPIYNIHHAFNGVEGLKLISKIHPDIIISDLMMPEMDGITMTKTIKNDFSTSHIPIIMLTSKSGMDDRIAGIEVGAESYILKPFNSKHLLTVIKTLLNQREIITKRMNSEAFASEVKITNKDEAFIKTTIKLIENNCQNPEFNVQEMISQSAMGRTVFSNKLKGLTGHTPVEFLRKIKLDIAKKHLIENNSSVAETSYLCGFNDVKYFSNCFKKEFGMTPSKFKKSLLEQPSNA